MRRAAFMWMLRLALVLVAGFQLPRVWAQCDGTPGPDGLTWDFEARQNDGFSVGGFLGGLFTPQLVKDARNIRDYVRDPRFGELTKRCGDLRAVDAIFLRSLKITEYNIGRALFLAMIACLEHQNVDVKVPVVGVLDLPLTFEQDSLFKSRILNLPSRLYDDTPPEGDRDKLQHFFASAYLSYVSESPEFARSAGNVVEWGEARIVVGGVDDPRDKRANKQGETFGHDLLYIKIMLPSDYLSMPAQGD